MAAAAAATAAAPPPVSPPETGAPAFSWEEEYAAKLRSWKAKYAEEDRRRSQFVRLMAEYEVPPMLCNAVRYCLPPARWPGKNLQQRARAAWAEVVVRGVGRHPEIATLDEKEVWALLGGAVCKKCNQPRPHTPDLDDIAAMVTALGEEDVTRATAVVEICRTLQALLALDGGDGCSGAGDGDGLDGHTTAAASPSSPSSAEASPGSAGDGAPRRRRNRRHRRRPAA